MLFFIHVIKDLQRSCLVEDLPTVGDSNNKDLCITNQRCACNSLLLPEAYPCTEESTLVMYIMYSSIPSHVIIPLEIRM